ncbi:MAG: STAS domain-containing protein [Gammaproteobacteria bacterium]|nr:STAS domain-containing protein [Gammaproteobacteria bacterium]MCH9745040.1 STAS domain-containing protein [Gammaproteobacteria bacterium]
MIGAVVKIETNNEGAAFSGVIRFETANEYCRVGTGYLQETSLKCLCFDLSGIEQSNIAGLTVLMTWLRVAKSLDKQLMFKGIPDALLNVAEICGVDQWIS